MESAETTWLSKIGGALSMMSSISPILPFNSVTNDLVLSYQPLQCRTQAANRQCSFIQQTGDLVGR